MGVAYFWSVCLSQSFFITTLLLSLLPSAEYAKLLDRMQVAYLMSQGCFACHFCSSRCFSQKVSFNSIYVANKITQVEIEMPRFHSLQSRVCLCLNITANKVHFKYHRPQQWNQTSSRGRQTAAEGPFGYQFVFSMTTFVNRMWLQCSALCCPWVCDL